MGRAGCSSRTGRRRAGAPHQAPRPAGPSAWEPRAENALRAGGSGEPAPPAASPTAMQSGWFFQVPPCRLPRPVPAPATPAGLGERAGTRGPGGARLTPLSPRRGLWAPFRIPHLKARDAGAPAADKAGTQPLSEASVEPGVHSPALPGRALRLPAWRLSTRPKLLKPSRHRPSRPALPPGGKALSPASREHPERGSDLYLARVTVVIGVRLPVLPL